MAGNRQESIERLQIVQLRRSRAVQIELVENHPHYLQERELRVGYVRDPHLLEIALQQGIYEGRFSGPGLTRQQGEAIQLPRQSPFERRETLKMSWAQKEGGLG